MGYRGHPPQITRHRKVEKLAVADLCRHTNRPTASSFWSTLAENERQDLTHALGARDGMASSWLSKWDFRDMRKRCARSKANLEDFLPEIRPRHRELTARSGRGIDQLIKAFARRSQTCSMRSLRYSSTAGSRQLDRKPSARALGPPHQARTNQVLARPPTLALFGNQLERRPESYLRDLMNGLRESLRSGARPSLPSARWPQPLFQR